MLNFFIPIKYNKIFRKLRTQKFQIMSSKRRRNETKKIRDSYPTKTLKELEDEGLVPKNFHIFDRVDMKEYHLKHKTDWWKRMSETT